MELRQLSYFCSVAAHRSFSKAAAVHYLTQPALSQQIQRLEVELGVPLFDRSARPVRLTSVGAYLLPQATAIIAAVQRLVNDAQDFATEVRGRVAIGAMQYLAGNELPDLLEAFRERYPAAELQLRMANTAQLVQLLQDGELDIAFCHREGVQPADDLAIEPLREEELVVIVARDHALAGRDTAMIDDLADEPFITFHRGASTHQALLQAFGAIDRVPQASFESADLSAAFALVKRRLGVALVPRSVAELDPMVGIVSLVPHPITLQVVQIWRTDRHASQAQIAFSRLARSLLARP